MAGSVQTIPLFPIPVKKEDRRQDLKTLLSLLSTPKKFSPHALTVFINSFRFFFGNISDDKLIEAMEKQERFSVLKTSETFQVWVQNEFKTHLGSCKSQFMHDKSFNKTLTGMSIVLCCLAHKTFHRDVWYAQLIEDATMEFKTSQSEFSKKFNTQLLRNIYCSLWSRETEQDQLVTLRQFIMNEIVSHNLESEEEVGKVVGFVKTKLAYIKMAGFDIVKCHLMDHCPPLHTWKYISADMDKFNKIYKKFEAMGTLGPYARVVLSLGESEQFNPIRYFKLVAVAVAIGLENNHNELLNYAPERMDDFREFINETRQQYKKMMGSILAKSVEIPLFPIPRKEESKKSDLQTLLSLLTMPKKVYTADAITVFINIIRFFFGNINDDKLIDAMEKEERFTALKTNETVQDWVLNNFQPYFGTCRNHFMNDESFNKTLTGISIMLCCLAHQTFNPDDPDDPDDDWYKQLIGDATKEFGKSQSQFQNLFNIFSLQNIYISLWSKGEKGQLLPPYTLRHFVMLKITSRNKGSGEEVRKVTRFLKAKLSYMKMVGFKIVQIYLIERCPELHNWKRISADMEKFNRMYKKFNAMGTLGPYARLVLSPEESEEFDPHVYLKLVAVGVAIGLEHNSKSVQKYAPERMKDFNGFINETRQYYRKMRRSELTTREDGFVDYDDDFAF